MSPFFSVIITTYNRPVKLIRAIESVLQQKFKDFELIIVNDGSTMDYSMVEEMAMQQSSQIKYFYKENEERSIARNFGVEKSKGRFICFLDDDDYYLKNHLEVIYKEILRRNFEEAIYHTYSIKFNQDRTFTRYDIVEKDPNLTEQEYYLSGGVMTMNCSCFAKKILEEFPYNPAFKMSEDSNQRLRAISKYKVFRIHEYTSVYDFSESSTNNDDIEIILEFRKTWKASFKDPLIALNVNKNLQKKILSQHIQLILNYYRKELGSILFFKYLIIYFYYSPNFLRAQDCSRFLYWKALSSINLKIIKK